MWAGKATLRFKFNGPITAAHHENDKVLSTIYPNQNLLPAQQTGAASDAPLIVDAKF